MGDIASSGIHITSDDPFVSADTGDFRLKTGGGVRVPIAGWEDIPFTSIGRRDTSTPAGGWACDPGYYHRDTWCEPFAGNCANGNLAEQGARTRDDHCGSCDDGFRLEGWRCI